MRALLLVALLASGCANMHVNRATLLASSLLLACDGLQTYKHARDGWPVFVETNPMLGSRPAPGEVSLYFATALVANWALWMALPRRWKSAAPTAVAAIQVDSIQHNLSRTPGVCGL